MSQMSQEQLDDIRATRKELRKVIRSVDEEIVSVFASAFAEVSSHFEGLFESLFPGGQGRLRLTTPDDLLETGLEVEARPSGMTLRLKEGGAFYAPSPLQCVAVHWPMITAGAQSGELYHLKVKE